MFDGIQVRSIPLQGFTIEEVSYKQLEKLGEYGDGRVQQSVEPNLCRASKGSSKHLVVDRISIIIQHHDKLEMTHMIFRVGRPIVYVSVDSLTSLRRNPECTSKVNRDQLIEVQTMGLEYLLVILLISLTYGSHGA